MQEGGVMSLVLREDVDLPEVAYRAVRLLRIIMNEHKINSFEDFYCPFTKDLAKELFEEV